MKFRYASVAKRHPTDRGHGHPTGIADRALGDERNLVELPVARKHRSFCIEDFDIGRKSHASRLEEQNNSIVHCVDQDETVSKGHPNEFGLFCSVSFDISSCRKTFSAKPRREVDPRLLPSGRSWRSSSSRSDDPGPIWLQTRPDDQLHWYFSEVSERDLMHLAGR